MPYQAGGEEPPVTLTDRYQAARMLRVGLKEAAVAANAIGPSGGFEMSLDAIRQYLERIQGDVDVAQLELKERRIREPKRRLHQISYRVSLINNLLGKLQQPTAGSPEAFRRNLERLYGLSQCLPTEPEIPVTPAENTLRAIVALLRYHRWSNVEPDGESVESIQRALIELAENLGPPVRYGPVPGQHSDYEEEDGSQADMDGGGEDDEYAEDEAEAGWQVETQPF